MKTPSEPVVTGPSLRDKIIGLGERSIRKSYYPQLRRQLEEAEKSRSLVEEKSAALLNMLEELEQARSSLADSQSHYRSLVENINDVIFSLDLKGKVTYISPVVQNFGGLKPEQVVGAPFMEFIHPDDRSAVAAAFERVLAGHREPHEFRVIDKEGLLYHVHTSSRPLMEEGRVVGLTGVIRDITARRQAEEEIRKLNQELEQRVAERTSQLEAANKELEAFAYSVSHDLRAPLRAIDGFSHILLEDYADKLDGECKRLLGVVRDNTSRMNQLIDDILKFSRAGRLEISISEIDMEHLARAVFEELQPSVTNSKLQMEIEHLPPTRGDSAMMRQVFVNLLSNAIKFSRTREQPKVQVGATVKDDETIYYVKDNGVGFDMQYADKLFGVFQRLHSVSEFEGTGIGLAIVKRIIARHGGRVWAEGKVNEGATVYFALPRDPAGQG
jgi:PAS domain S-box-containing protein